MSLSNEHIGSKILAKSTSSLEQNYFLPYAMRYPVLHDNIITYLLTKNRYDFFIENFILCILWSIVFNTSGILSTYCTDSYVKINSLHNLHKPYIFEIFIVLLFIFRGWLFAVNGLAIINGPTYFSGVQWKVDHIFIESKIVTTDIWKKKCETHCKLFQTYHYNENHIHTTYISK